MGRAPARDIARNHPREEANVAGAIRNWACRRRQRSGWYTPCRVCPCPGPAQNIRSLIPGGRGRGGPLSRRSPHPRRSSPICSRPSSRPSQGMGEPILVVEYLRSRRSLRADVTPTRRAVRVARNLDDPVALHMDKDLADTVAAPARRSDDASGRTHRSLPCSKGIYNIVS